MNLRSENFDGLESSPLRVVILDVKPLEFGGKLECQYRANLENESRKCVTTKWGASPREMMI